MDLDKLLEIAGIDPKQTSAGEFVQDLNNLVQEMGVGRITSAESIGHYVGNVIGNTMSPEGVQEFIRGVSTAVREMK